MLVVMRQLNWRCSGELAGLVAAAAGPGGRNAWLTAAAWEKLEREGGVVTRGPGGNTPGVGVVTPGRVSARAPRGCRVVGVSRLARELVEGAEPVVIPGQLDLGGVLS